VTVRAFPSHCFFILRSGPASFQTPTPKNAELPDCPEGVRCRILREAAFFSAGADKVQRRESRKVLALY